MKLKVRGILSATSLVCICVSVIHYSRSYGNTTQLCSFQDYSETNTSVMYSIGPKGDEKYRQLLQEALRSYQHYHHVKRRELVRGKSSRTLTWYCVSGCGGIGDRVKGMLASFLLAMVTNRTFFIHMSNEVQKTMFLEPNAIDWRPVRSCVEILREHILEKPGVLQRDFLGSKCNTSIDLNRLINVDHIYMSKKEKLSNIIDSVLHSNIASNLSFGHYMLLHSVLGKERYKSYHHIAHVIYHYLFKMQWNVKNFTKIKLAELNLRPQSFVTVHIRTGFKNRLFGELRINWTYLKGERFARTEESWRDMIECALSISATMFGSNSKILVVSDDKEPKTWAASEYKSRIVMLDVDPVHVSGMATLGVFKSRPKNVYLDTWVELSVMSESAALVGIKSGYLDVASYAGDFDRQSLYTYDIRERTCMNSLRFVTQL